MAEEEELINNDGKALAEFLKASESKPNVITLNTFNKFAVLFRKVTKKLTAEEEGRIKDLSDQYYRLIDPYKITYIIKSEREPIVVLKLPRIFTPIRQLPHNDKNDLIVSKNRKLSQSGAPPKYQAEAFRDMATAVLEEQLNNIDVIKDAQNEHREVMDGFFEAYGKKEKAVAKQEAPVITNDEWDFD